MLFFALNRRWSECSFFVNEPLITVESFHSEFVVLSLSVSRFSLSFRITKISRSELFLCLLICLADKCCDDIISIFPLIPLRLQSIFRRD